MDEELRDLERRAKNGGPAEKHRYWRALDRLGHTIDLVSVMSLHPEPAARAWPQSYGSFTEAWQACKRPDWMLYALCEADRALEPRIQGVMRMLMKLLSEWLLNVRGKWELRRRLPQYLIMFNSWIVTPVPEEMEIAELTPLLRYLTRDNLTDEQRIDLHDNFVRVATRHMEDQQFARPADASSQPEALHQIGTFVLMACSAGTSPELQTGIGAGWMYNPVLSTQSLIRAMRMVDATDAGQTPERVLEVEIGEEPAMAHLIRDAIALPLRLADT